MTTAPRPDHAGPAEAPSKPSGRSAAPWRLAFLLGLCALCACGTPPRSAAPPDLASRTATLASGEPLRVFGDEASDGFVAIARAARAQRARDGRAARPETFLALSGGGADGAYGAGLLVGWTEHGTRPEFDVVTGVSAGALIAPFAFLGPARDGQLEEAFTSVSTEDFLAVDLLRPLFGGASIGSGAGLRRQVARHLDAATLEAIAAEHRRGRRLLIGTTDLDAQRPVVWNLGAIAATRDPGRLELARAVLVASASIPGLFDPVVMRVTVAGVAYDELHADGAVANSVFLYPPGLDGRDLAGPRGGTRSLYLVRNGKVAPGHSPVRASLADVTARALGTLTRNQAAGDLLRLHVAAARDGLAFRLAHIPAGFDAPSEEPFDPAYMRALFALGRAEAREGYEWRDRPPGGAVR